MVPQPQPLAAFANSGVEVNPVPAAALPAARQAPAQHPQQVAERELFCIARRPYVEPLSWHDLGRMDSICVHCGAAHWLDERLSKSSAQSPKFGV